MVMIQKDTLCTVAQVYQGMWNGATPVAVKFIIPHVSKEEHVRNLYKEINVLKECRHTNIVQFYGACLKVRCGMLLVPFFSLCQRLRSWLTYTIPCTEQQLDADYRVHGGWGPVSRPAESECRLLQVAPTVGR